MTLNLSVIGTNYLGATHAAGMAEFGHQVIGVDIDADRVKTLNSGESHIFEVGLEPLLETHTSSGRLRFTTDYAEIADWADVHFLALGTPSGPGGAADLSQLHAAVDSLAPRLTRPCLVVGKSTVPVGTAMQLQERLRSQAPAGRRHRGGLEPGVPARGVRGGGHPAARPAGLRHPVAARRWSCWRRSTRCRSATGPRWSGATSPPPS